MTDKEKLLAKIEQMSEYDVSVLLRQLEYWKPMPILRYAAGKEGEKRRVSWSSEALGLKYPNLVRLMARRGYNLPDLQIAMGLKTWEEAAECLRKDELDLLPAAMIVNKLFPTNGLAVFDPRYF